MSHSNNDVVLTPKQRETLELLGKGYTSKEIAKVSGVSPSAIDQRIECMLKKCRRKDRRELIEWHRDHTVQSAASTAQVSHSTVNFAGSISDQRSTTSEEALRDIDGISSSPPRVLVVAVPETGARRLRSELEITFMGVMILVGFYLVLKQLFA